MNRNTKEQAVKSSKAQIDLEIKRRRALREKYLTDNDEPNAIELLATAAIVIVAALAFGFGWMW